MDREEIKQERLKQEKLKNAIVKVQKGLFLTDDDLSVLQEHYIILAEHLKLEGDRMLLAWKYCYDGLMDVNYLIEARND